MNVVKVIYTTLPRGIQDSVNKAYGAIPRRLLFGKAYADVRKTLTEEESWTYEQRKTYQFAQLKKLLIHAYETTKYYCDLFKAVQFDPYQFSDVSQMSIIPLLEKEDVQRNMDLIRSSAFKKKQMQANTTGGTSGNQMKFFQQKNYTIPRELAFVDYYFQKAEYTVNRDFRVMLRNNVLPEGQLWQYDYRYKYLILDPYHMTNTNMHKLVSKLNEVQIPFFHVYPSAITTLCEYMRRANDFINYLPKAVFATSENVYPGQRELVEEVMGCQMLSQYGHSEMGCFAGWCLQENHYHIEDTYGFTELLDERGNQINAEGVRGEIVTTGFNNYVLPLIRYRTNDYASYGPRHHAYDTFSNVEGRWLQEMLITSQGNKISMTALNMHSDIFDQIVRYQFYQDTPGICILNVVKAEQYSSKDEAAVRHAFQEKMGRYLELRIQYVDHIAIPANGKYRYIIQKLNVKEP